MNLKKAFQYQKAIKKIMDELISCNSINNPALLPANFCEVKDIHKRSELNYLFPTEERNYQDEVKIKKSLNVQGYELPKLLQIYNYLAVCRRKLAQAIADCKNEMEIGAEKFSYDAAVIYANDLRAPLTIYEVMVSLKEEERNSINEITFSSNNEKLSAEYTVTTVTRPLPGVVEAAKAEYNRVRAYTAELSDMIEAATLMSRLDPAAEPAFPVTANLNYIYEHFEELQGK
ncbi:hypothetical protein [uncultured Phascolarctobacterium sp.]|uniref:hypothetical protein n=1 Tax=uncultured Phascolarctobacterium sp. TaxID=512296 RepID=UPI0025FCCEBD|nr:hypothetical protein [uncultured Phascolarctobacterium sp.]